MPSLIQVFYYMKDIRKKLTLITGLGSQQFFLMAPSPALAHDFFFKRLWRLIFFLSVSGSGSCNFSLICFGSKGPKKTKKNLLAPQPCWKIQSIRKLYICYSSLGKIVSCYG